jgi:hypothetical protein
MHPDLMAAKLLTCHSNSATYMGTPMDCDQGLLGMGGGVLRYIQPGMGGLEEIYHHSRVLYFLKQNMFIPK